MTKYIVDFPNADLSVISWMKKYVESCKVAEPVVEEKKDDKCSYCAGSGIKMDDSYSTFKCPWCGGSGKAKDANVPTIS
jgi:predicted RNA-binding Zn-ribbon protein involved in translation (DUF1610 family)